MALDIGQRLARREIQNDGWDLVQIVGVADLGPDLGSEIVIRPAVEFASPLACTSQSLLSVYTLDTTGPPAPLDGPWETAPEEVGTGG